MSTTEVWMCYGCCCGVEKVDAKWKPRREPIDRIRAALESKLAMGNSRGISIRKTGCLGPCEKGNMAVVYKKGMDATVFRGINTLELGEEVANYAMDVERKGWGAVISEKLERQAYGTVSADEVPPPPSPEPYKDRH